jgi:hypothetical protein
MKRLLMIALLIPMHLFAQNTQNNLINWFAGADIVGTSGNQDADLEGAFYVREFEISANSKIDQTFEGVLTLSYHNEIESEDEHFEIHEAFVLSNKIFDNSVVKLGKFFLGFGRLNRFHRHDWVMTDAPMIQKAFFGNEGAKDTGLEIKHNLPSASSTITFGLTSGREFLDGGHHHEDEGAEEDEHHGGPGKSPTAYLRWAYFHEFTTQKGFELGFNLLNRTNEESVNFKYGGIDFIYKDRAGKIVNNLVQAEAWYNTETHSEGDEDEQFHNIGAYLYYEKGIDQHHAIGFRADYFKPDTGIHEHLEAENENGSIDGLSVHGEYQAASMSYIYTNSEFSRFRITAEYLDGIETENGAETAFRAFAQIVFSIGAHPAHIY